MPTASEQIIAEVTSWPGITAVDGTRGELSFRLWALVPVVLLAIAVGGYIASGSSLVGLIGSNPPQADEFDVRRSAHFAFPRDVADELRATGRVGPHPAFPDHPKLAARRIEGPDDVADVIVLLRANYDREVARTPAGAA